MSFIFLDESGDLGFDFSKKGTTKYFIITFLYTAEKRKIEKVVKNIHKGLKKSYKHKVSHLHANKEKPVTRTRFLKLLAEKEINVMVIYLNKKKVYTKLKNEKEILYNYVTNILLDRIYSKKLVPFEGDITLIASRKETNKFLNKNFKDYLSRQIKNNFKSNLEVIIKTPFEEKALQAVDFVSWSVFRKYEYCDESYYNIIKKKIIEENALFA
jgi:hypothetical protein